MTDTLAQDFIEGFVKAARAAGRAYHVQYTPYLAGKQAALEKFGGMGLHDKLDLAGLGLLAAPVMHSAITDHAQESPGMRRTKTIAELAGLATLAASTLSKAH